MTLEEALARNASWQMNPAVRPSPELSRCVAATLTAEVMRLQEVVARAKEESQFVGHNDGPPPNAPNRCQGLSTSPLPWKIHNTGGYIAVVDATKKPVIRKTTNTLTIEQFRALKANLEFIVGACNGSVEAIS